MSTESALLAEELTAEPERANNVNFIGIQFPSIDSIDYLGVHPQARLYGVFMSPAVRKGMQQGRATLQGTDYLGTAHLLQRGPPVDVAIAQLSAPDSQGFCSLGLSSDFMPLVWKRAQRRVATSTPNCQIVKDPFAFILMR